MASIFQSNPVNPKYNSPTPDRITLMAGMPNTVDRLDDNACKKIADCGFNAVGAIITQPSLRETLDYCQQNSLKLFVYNYGLIYDSVNFVNTYKDHPSLGGWLLKFNLQYQEIAGYLKDPVDNTPNTFHDIITANNDIKSTDDKEHPIFIGLEGDWDYLDRQSGTSETFPTYIAKVQKYLEPSFWPYIYFPDAVPSGDSSEATKEQRQLLFYKNLQYFAYVARYTGNHFWAFVRCQGFDNYKGYTAPKPNINLLRGIVFSALAYGAQGLYYWNFRQRSVFTDAPTDADGNENADTYATVKTINEEVKAYNDVFAGGEMVECRHYMGNSMFSNSEIKTFDYPMGPLMSISSNALHNNKLLISHICNDGRNFLVIVVNPFFTYDNPAIVPTLLHTLYFNEYWTVYLVKSYKEGKQDKKELTNYNYLMNSKPGDYYIFEWE